MTICVECKHCIKYGTVYYCGDYPKQGYTPHTDPVTGKKSIRSPQGTDFDCDAMCVKFERCSDINGEGDCPSFVPLPPQPPSWQIMQALKRTVPFLRFFC